MGLDITAYRDIEKIDCVFDGDGEPINPSSREPLNTDYFQIYVNPDFSERADGLDHKAVYKYAEEMDFRAGSYSGYNHWREQLAELAGWPKVETERWGQKLLRHDAATYDAKGGPFWELIRFSDCEGTIGPKTSAKLAKDFADHQGKADAHPDIYFRNVYNNFRAGFEMAAQNGAVDFH